jgi:branched-chain amino acid transport system ATP-binding protein
MSAATTPAEDSGAANGLALLACSGVSVNYGKLRVLDTVDFRVGSREAVGIVGPNGAGKTTLLNAIAGSVLPQSGSIRFLDQDVTSLRPDRRCRLGIGRAFQIPRPFGGMTVLENVLVGAAYGAQLGKAERYERCIEVLDLCRLTELANRHAESLGLLSRKRLELARALATNPRVLLLDEIGGGLTDAEADELVDTINGLREYDVSIVWIEHIVHVLLRVVDRLVAMDAGRVIADGDPQEVLRNADVIDAYLGKAGA